MAAFIAHLGTESLALKDVEASLPSIDGMAKIGGAVGGGRWTASWAMEGGWVGAWSGLGVNARLRSRGPGSGGGLPSCGPSEMHGLGLFRGLR